jgi:hypothetical protein
MLDDVYNLEMEIKEKYDMLVHVSKQKCELEDEVKVLGETLDNKNEERIKLEFLLEKQKEFLKETSKSKEEEVILLKEEVKAVKVQADAIEKEYTKETSKNLREKKMLFLNIETLQSDILKLQKINEEKEKQLNDVLEENKCSVEKMNFLEELNKNLDNRQESSINATAITLQEELGLGDDISTLTLQFRCNYCEKEFNSELHLKEHVKIDHVQNMKTKLLEVEKHVSEQSKKVFQSLFKLKQKELKEKKKPCHCKGVCRIHHSIFNWNKSKNDLIFTNAKRIEIWR